MNPTSEQTNSANFDVREISCREKHPLIFRRWEELPVGGHFVLINDHDPVPLYYQFAAMFPGAFEWRYLESSPDEFHVKITRLAPSPERPAVAPPPSSCGHRHERAGEVDARGLEPPGPMLRILEAVEAMPRGGRLRAFTDRRPVHLYPELESRQVTFASEQQPDGS